MNILWTAFEFGFVTLALPALGDAMLHQARVLYRARTLLLRHFVLSLLGIHQVIYTITRTRNIP